jgi:hypothetical protein
VVLLNHLDVVPAERAFWSAEPFGGEIRDGHVWGRGALDMKGSASRSERPDWTRRSVHYRGQLPAPSVARSGPAATSPPCSATRRSSERSSPGTARTAGRPR